MKKLIQLIHDEFGYAAGLSLLIFLVVFLLMVEMANQDYQDIRDRQNHVEYRMNNYDKNIPEVLINE